MIISDLSYLESAETYAVVGGNGGCEPDYTWSESDLVTIEFETSNTFTLDISTNLCLDPGNFASAGAKASADIGSYDGCDPLNSFSKADILAVTTYGEGSFSGATGVAAIGY